MFGIGSMEFAVIIIVAVLVLGPDHLPKVLRTVQKVMSDFRRVSTEIQRTINLEEHMKAMEEEAPKPKPKKKKKKTKPAASEEATATASAPDAVASAAPEVATFTPPEEAALTTPEAHPTTPASTTVATAAASPAPNTEAPAADASNTPDNPTAPEKVHGQLSLFAATATPEIAAPPTAAASLDAAASQNTILPDAQGSTNDEASSLGAPFPAAKGGQA